MKLFFYEYINKQTNVAEEFRLVWKMFIYEKKTFLYEKICLYQRYNFDEFVINLEINMHMKTDFPFT